MSSRDNHIYHGIQELLQEEPLTPEMEGVIAVMCAYRPRVEIDASYRNKLKKSLLTPSAKKVTHTHPSWFAWMSWVGTSFAALIVTLGVVRVLFPERPILPEHTPLTVESPLPEVATLMQDITSDTVITDSNTESTIPKPQTAQDDIPMTRMTEISSEPTSRDVVPSTSDSPAPILADASVGGGYMMMAMPEGDTLAKTATPTTTTESPSPDTSSDISSEIQDMVWEINSIISEAGSRDHIIIPDYPTSMPIYIKEGAFTPEETMLHIGTGITSTLISTYTPTDLEAIIIDKRGSMTIASSPEVRYISYKKGNQNILVPTVIYTTASGSTLEVPLVEGY